MNIFEQAIDLHTRWRLRITKEIIEGAVMDTSDIGNCHACELGAWIYSHGLKYNNLASFEAMCSRHEHFHRAAAEVAQCGNAGETTRVMALLSPGGVFDQTSLMLIASLKECSKELDLTEEEPCPIVRVSDILERKDDKRIYSIEASASIRDALKMMVADQIGLLVVYKSGQFVGLFTERGFVEHISVKGSISLEEPVERAINRKLININKESSLDDCMEIMSATHARHAVVFGADKVDGIISVTDIIDELKTNKIYPYKFDKNLYSRAVPGFGKSKH